MFDYPSYEKHYNAFDNYIVIFIVINKEISVNLAIRRKIGLKYYSCIVNMNFYLG